MRAIQKILILILSVFIILTTKLSAQNKPNNRHYMEVKIVNGDTILHTQLPELYVFPKKVFRNKRHKRAYWRMVRRVKKVYPLAVEAKYLLIKYEPIYVQLESKRDKRKLMKQLEKELFSKHKKELKKWSIKDGRVLLKLINRETERSPYTIIRDFRGRLSAAFWQTLAKIFKNDLKAGYDPEDDDKMIEEIVQKVEAGYL